MSKYKNTEYLETKISELEGLDYSSLDEEKMSFMIAGHVGAIRTLSDAYHLRTKVQIFLGILSGIWIGLAYTAAIYAAETLTNASMQKLIIGAIFPLVILMIFFVGGNFFTAYTYAFSSVIRGMIRWKETLWAWLWIYIGNMLGCLIFVLVFQLSGALNFDAAHAKLVYALGLSKLYYIKSDVLNDIINQKSLWSGISVSDIFKTIVCTFFSAILCNALVSNTIVSVKSTKGNIVATMILFWSIIFLFVTCGYQHSVANWHIIWLFIVMGFFQDVVTIANDQDTISITASLDLGWMLIIFSLIPSIFGNLAGALLIGELHHYAYGDASKAVLNEQKIKNYKYYLNKIKNQKESVKSK